MDDQPQPERPFRYPGMKAYDEANYRPSRARRWLFAALFFVAMALMSAKPGQFGNGLLGQVNDDALAALHKYVTH